MCYKLSFVKDVYSKNRFNLGDTMKRNLIDYEPLLAWVNERWVLPERRNPRVRGPSRRLWEGTEVLSCPPRRGPVRRIMLPDALKDNAPPTCTTVPRLVA